MSHNPSYGSLLRNDCYFQTITSGNLPREIDPGHFAKLIHQISENRLDQARSGSIESFPFHEYE